MLHRGHSVNDCVDFYGLKIYRRKNGQFGKKPGRKSSKDRKRELEQKRRKGVELAWKEERKLVQRSGTGSRIWTDAEIDELLTTGKIKGYVGHHINSVSTYPELADVPGNIQFLTPQEHILAHGGNFHNPVQGQLINR